MNQFLAPPEYENIILRCSLLTSMIKVSVIGVGNLGSCIAYEIARRNLADELVLVDVRADLAEGNAGDISQALAFKSNINIFSGEYRDVEGSDLIILTAGKPRTPQMKSRMELLEANKNIIKSVIEGIKDMAKDSIIVTLTNPVDVMNYLVWLYGDFRRERVLGSAGQLDSARFRIVLSRRFRVPVLDVDGYVIGEHGENIVPVFSKVKVKGKKVNFTSNEKSEILEELRRTALNVISKKGATVYAPANNTVDIVEAVIKNEKKLFICSTVLNGEYGLKDVSIGVPVIVGKGGVEEIIEWDLSNDEADTLASGAERLSHVISKLRQAEN